MAFQGIDPYSCTDEQWTGGMMTAAHYDDVKALRTMVERYMEAMAKASPKRRR